MNARYYNGKIGRFISQDPAFLAVGDYGALKSKTGQDLQSYLSDPQSFNSYAYARNNPLRIIDPTGEFFLDAFGINISNGQRGVANSFHDLGNYFRNPDFNYMGHGAGFISDIMGDVANNVATVFDPRESLGKRVFAGGVSVLDVSSGGKGGMAKEVLPKIANGLRLGQTIPSLGKVIENASGKISGFNHNGTFHGLDQVISRGVDPQTIIDTVKNPIARFAGRFERIGYLTNEAYVVLDKTGQVVTSWTKNEFGSTIKNLLNGIK